MEQSFNKRFIKWRDIDEAIERLAINITISKIEIAAVGGLPRGGLIPAVMLSHTLNIPFVSQANIAGVDGNILIVDDICDSGKTLKRFKFENNVYTATLHYKSAADRFNRDRAAHEDKQRINAQSPKSGHQNRFQRLA